LAPLLLFIFSGKETEEDIGDFFECGNLALGVGCHLCERARTAEKLLIMTSRKTQIQSRSGGEDETF